MLFTGAKRRPCHLGLYPLERLRRAPSMRMHEEARGPAKMSLPTPSSESNSLGAVDRKAALAEAGRMETPLEALARKATEIPS